MDEPFLTVGLLPRVSTTNLKFVLSSFLVYFLRLLVFVGQVRWSNLQQQNEGTSEQVISEAEARRVSKGSKPNGEPSLSRLRLYLTVNDKLKFVGHLRT